MQSGCCTGWVTTERGRTDPLPAQKLQKILEGRDFKRYRYMQGRDVFGAFRGCIPFVAILISSFSSSATEPEPKHHKGNHSHVACL